MSKEKEEQLSFNGMLESEGTEIIPTDEESSAPLSVYSDRPAFLPEDITPPILKLLQALSPEVVEGAAKAGVWALAGFTPASTVTIVPISFARRREYRPEGEQLLACASYDGETGEGTPGGFCHECPMNKWTGEGKNRKGPQCVFMYSYMVYIVEFETVALINFKRTGLGVGRSLNSIVARSGMKSVAVQLGSKLQTGGKGSYYIPQLLPMSPADMTAPVEKARKFLGI